jgi:hypothetical protein
MNDQRRTGMQMQKRRASWWIGLCLAAVVVGVAVVASVRCRSSQIPTSQPNLTARSSWRAEVRQLVSITKYLLTPEDNFVVLVGAAPGAGGALPEFGKLDRAHP